MWKETPDSWKTFYISSMALLQKRRCKIEAGKTSDWLSLRWLSSLEVYIITLLNCACGSFSFCPQLQSYFELAVLNSMVLYFTTGFLMCATTPHFSDLRSLACHAVITRASCHSSPKNKFIPCKSWRSIPSVFDLGMVRESLFFSTLTTTFSSFHFLGWFFSFDMYCFVSFLFFLTCPILPGNNQAS